MRIMVINGPNLNLTGIRERSVYGTETLEDINKMIEKYASEKAVECEFFQSNSEGALIDCIHRVLLDDFDGAVINAGAYTHYSYAIRDAISATSKPFIEVHMSDIHKREQFRHVSVIEEVCRKQIAGFGSKGYLMGIDELVRINEN